MRFSGFRRLATPATPAATATSTLMSARKIVVVDSLPPEANAMVQALYSRSPKSVDEHLTHVKRVGPEKFMQNFYVGYGHKSIGDCGTTTIFIENVSMLAAKAIQDWPLYNGQEASTRYIDFAKQSVVQPADLSLRESWMRYYSIVVDRLVASLSKQYPRGAASSASVYDKAIRARAFDIARGFLPAGATTYVSWHTNLRQAHDHLEALQYHPLEEVRSIAAEIRTSLSARYPSSFVHKIREPQQEYLKKTSNPYQPFGFNGPNTFGTFSWSHNLDIALLNRENAHIIRPARAELPGYYRHFGTLTFDFLLDYGSYRDLQRHRSAVITQPFLDTSFGFEPWYLSQLPEDLRQLSEHLLREHTDRMNLISSVSKQYLIPMGFRVPIKMTCSLPSAVYIAELRSADTVHPTLRKIAQQMGHAIKAAVPGIAMYCDTTPVDSQRWNERRGTQDITEKKD